MVLLVLLPVLLIPTYLVSDGIVNVMVTRFVQTIQFYHVKKGRCQIKHLVKDFVVHSVVVSGQVWQL